uniref:Uncharacterized protein n=1 Tax=Rhizophora mucronata TaxID=61149 RepID=A0A2P2N7U6_RHIMU
MSSSLADRAASGWRSLIVRRRRGPAYLSLPVRSTSSRKRGSPSDSPPALTRRCSWRT